MQSIFKQKHGDALELAGGAVVFGYLVCAVLLIGQYLGTLS